MRDYQRNKKPKKFIILERIATNVCTYVPYDPEVDLTVDVHGEHINLFIAYADSRSECRMLIRNRKGPHPCSPIDDRDLVRDRSMDFNATQKLAPLYSIDSKAQKIASYEEDPEAVIKQLVAERQRKQEERINKYIAEHTNNGWHCIVHGLYLAQKAVCINCKSC